VQGTSQYRLDYKDTKPGVLVFSLGHPARTGVVVSVEGTKYHDCTIQIRWCDGKTSESEPYRVGNFLELLAAMEEEFQKVQVAKNKVMNLLAQLKKDSVVV
jgi:hypothetical protein